MFFVFRKDRNTFLTEADKEGTFPEVKIYEISCSEYLQFHKSMKIVESLSYRSTYIGNVVHIWGEYGAS